MSRRSVSMEFDPPDFSYGELARGILDEVLGRLRLRSKIASVRCIVRPRHDRDDGVIAWTNGSRLRVRLYLDAGNFLTPRGRRALAREAPPLSSLPRRRFSARTLRSTLLHEFSHVADEISFGIRTERVPRRRWADFNEAWNVWIDGRLSRRGTHGVRRDERLRLFRLTFARPGRRFAHHRVLFDRLWRAERLSHEDLLEAAGRLRSPAWEREGSSRLEERARFPDSGLLSGRAARRGARPQFPGRRPEDRRGSRRGRGGRRSIP